VRTLPMKVPKSLLESGAMTGRAGRLRTPFAVVSAGLDQALAA
jgi:hypothetical protein